MSPLGGDRFFPSRYPTRGFGPIPGTRVSGLKTAVKLIQNPRDPYRKPTDFFGLRFFETTFGFILTCYVPLRGGTAFTVI